MPKGKFRACCFTRPLRGSMIGMYLLVLLLFINQAKTNQLHPTLIEGDIVYNEQFKILTEMWRGRPRRDTLSDRKFLWDNAVVPYTISSDMTIRGRKVIKRAFREIARRTCVTFIPKQTYHEDHVFFVSGKGCFSSIGRVGKRQVLSLHDNCKYRGKVVHEILHALGFFHEHSRGDRDKYIKVIWKNIQKGMRRNFLSYKHGPIDTLGEPYDFQSIMHYDNKAFSKNGGDTLRSLKNPKMKLGQVKKLSRTDITQVMKLYRCESAKMQKNRPCVDLKSSCRLRTAKSDICEVKYKLMKELCSLSCGFCG